MESLQQRLGSQIKELRRLKGYTQAELAELAGVSMHYIGCVERGERTISLQALERIARILEVEISTLFLLPAQRAASISKPPDRKARILAKLATFLEEARQEDVSLIFKLVKQLTRHARS